MARGVTDEVLAVALKEWQCVWRLVLEGRFALLIRKGGIRERGGAGRFEVEHGAFAAFPAWEHQRPAMLKPAFREGAAPGEEPPEIEIAGWAEAARLWQLTDRDRFDALDALHPWSAPQVDMRFGYKPERPLWLLAVRAYRLPAPKTILNRPAYAGCRSWVPLEPGDAVEIRGSDPAMNDRDFDALLEEVDAVLGAGRDCRP